MSTRGDAVVAGGELLHSKARARLLASGAADGYKQSCSRFVTFPAVPQTDFDAVSCRLSHATAEAMLHSRRAEMPQARGLIAATEPSPTAEEHYKTTRRTLGAIAKIRAGSEDFTSAELRSSVKSTTARRTTRTRSKDVGIYTGRDGWRGTWVSRLAVAEESLVVDPRLQALEVEPARGLGR